MSLSRRSFTSFGKVLAAAALVAAGAQSAVPQVRGKGPQPLRVTGSQSLLGDHITFTTPQFKVEALWFKANDETGWYWTGSDEVYAVFSDMHPTHTDRTTSEYDNVDEGDTVNFGANDRCMAAQPNCGGMADLNVRFSFWESDWEAPLGFSYCNDADTAGLRWRVEVGICVDDDLIGKGSIIHSSDVLVAMLPAVGASREFTAVMDKDEGKYRFRYRITRLANIERSIVIHLPPDWGETPPPPPITLQAVQVMDGIATNTVRLTWSGATTSTVDIFRNGAKVTTTANDGDHVDTVASGTYQYRVCDLNSTSACSADVTLVVT